MLIPFRTDRPRIRPAYLTIGLIVVNTLIQIYSMILPLEVVSIGMGGQWYQAEESSMVLHYGLWGSHPTLLTLFTHMFLHGDLLHLAGNMLFLWLFGSLIEDVLRPWGMAALYLGGGMAAAWAHIGICHALGVNLTVPGNASAHPLPAPASTASVDGIAETSPTQNRFGTVPR